METVHLLRRVCRGNIRNVPASFICCDGTARVGAVGEPSGHARTLRGGALRITDLGAHQMSALVSLTAHS